MGLTDKYRPKEWDDVIGNEENVEFLKKTLEKTDHSHSYLFQGDHGCGKTTMGRILSSVLDCDIVEEINGSNYRGIDAIREIIETIKYATLTGGKRCLIIDEVHKMTNDAQNALLKDLEEPPKHVYFILCTTDPQKLLPTIRSRCVQIAVEQIDVRTLIQHLQYIVESEGKEIPKKVLRKISQTSEGHVRDALNILEKVLEIDDEEKQLKVAENKLVEDAEIIDLCRALMKKDNWNEVKTLVKNLKEDPERIRQAILGYMTSVLLSDKSPAQAALVIEEFSENFFSSGKAGLVLSCFRVFC